MGPGALRGWLACTFGGSGAGEREGEAASHCGQLPTPGMSLGDSLGSCSHGGFVSSCGAGGVCVKGATNLQGCTLDSLGGDPGG